MTGESSAIPNWDQSGCNYDEDLTFDPDLTSVADYSWLTFNSNDRKIALAANSRIDPGSRTDAFTVSSTL